MELKMALPNDLNSQIGEVVNIPIIASGGAGTMEHIRDAFLIGKSDAALADQSFILER